MLDFCLETFNKQYEIHGDSLILDRYSLTSGLYLIVDKDTGEILEADFITRNNNNDREYLKRYAKIDYLSNILEMNKPASRTKEIHSNNYLSFFVKASNIIEDDKGVVKTTLNTIDTYFNDLANTTNRMSQDKFNKDIYDKTLERYGEIDFDNLNKCHSWVRNNLLSLTSKFKIDKKTNYVRIFFKEKIEVYERESNRYIEPRIYNKNKYNKIFDGVLYGVPNNNFGLNEKKPYLLLHNKKTKEPILVTMDQAICMKKFFDYLMCLVSTKPSLCNLYIDEDNLIPLDSLSIPPVNFSGVYLSLKKEKNEVEILDFDIIENFNAKPKITVEKIIDFSIEAKDRVHNITYGKMNNLISLKNNIDSVFYNGFLSKTLHQSCDEIKASGLEMKLKKSLISSKASYTNWFYKGDTTLIKSTFDKESLESIHESLANDRFLKAIEQLNLRISVLKYLKGDDKDMRKMYQEIYSKMENNLLDGDLTFNNIDEYCFFVGQAAYVLLTQSKAQKKSMDMIKILECSSPSLLKKKFNLLYRRYRHANFMNDRIMRKTISTILDYDTGSSKVNLEALNCGYLYKNSILQAKVINKKIAKNSENNGQVKITV